MRHDGELRRDLGTLDVALLVVGIIVGAGIFTTPGVVAGQLSSPAWILAAWAIGGAIALGGALLYAELGSAMPRAGGDYVYLRECFGPWPAFLYGWLFFTVSGTGSIAALAAAAGEYAGAIWPGAPGFPIAAGAVLALTALNVVGLRAGATVQNALSAVKIVALAAVIVLALVSAARGAPAPAAEAASDGTTGGVPVWALAAALVPILFTYMGWNAAGYVGAEVRAPGRTLPRGLLVGTVLVTVLYVAINAALLRALTPAEMSGDVQVAAAACEGALGANTRAVVGAVVLVSILGGLNGMVLTHARVLYAMAREGHFLRVFGRVHPRWRTPVAALLLQAGWSLALLATGTFERLVGYVTFAMVAMSCAAVAGVFVLRRRGGHAGFRSPAFPWLPLGFIAAGSWVLVGVVRFAPWDAAIGLCMALVGGLAYPVWRWFTRRQGGDSSGA